ncbi:MAG: DUF3450 family protein [Desulfobacterales bacterium]|nr:DUF3450 family protein [Desulfobacterales bacterium]
MKRFIAILMLSLLAATAQIGSLHAKDLRQAMQSAQAALAQKKAEDAASKKRIAQSRKDHKTTLASLEKEIKALKVQKTKEEKRQVRLTKESDTLTLERDKLDKAVGRIVAVVRTAAKNLRDLTAASPFSVFAPTRLKRLEAMADGTEFPGLDDLRTLFGWFHDEIEKTQEVAIRPATFTDRMGNTQERSVLTAGPFMSLVLKENGPEPLLYDPSTQAFRELPDAPGRLFAWRLKRYTSGKTDVLPMDISSGAALDHLRRTPSFMERIENGGPLVWPILLIGVLGILIGIERALFLKKVHDNTDKTMGAVNELASYGNWDECDLIVKERKSTPVYNVLRKGLEARGERRQVLETVLQEAILKELPRLERFLPFLGMLGAIAPLLGLLGTVTGMIDTFEVIHMAGTGDPRMMSGGISTALITTMLGLAVAIPIMLLHTVLNRQVEHITGDMEEKAVALTNIVHRETLRPCQRSCPAGMAGLKGI